MYAVVGGRGGLNDDSRRAKGFRPRVLMNPAIAARCRADPAATLEEKEDVAREADGKKWVCQEIGHLEQ